jgi:CheY-like chemotaxis protein
MRTADNAPGGHEDRSNAVTRAGDLGDKTFAELFCARFGVKPENFSKAVLRRTLYPRARLVAPLLRLFFRDYFEADHDFIAGTGRLRDLGQMAAEIRHYQRHMLNHGYLRQGLRLRVSAFRMTRLVNEIMEEGSGSDQEYISGKAAGTAPSARSKLSPAAGEPGRGPANDVADATGAPIRILCVEDHAPSRKLYQTIFERAGYACECVNDGREAYELLASNPRRYDVVITDHEMPRIDGLELVRLLREAAIPVEIIVVSGSLQFGECQAYEPLRVGKIICKPLTPGILIDAVAKLTRKAAFD